MLKNAVDNLDNFEIPKLDLIDPRLKLKTSSQSEADVYRILIINFRILR